MKDPYGAPLCRLCITNVQVFTCGRAISTGPEAASQLQLGPATFWANPGHLLRHLDIRSTHEGEHVSTSPTGPRSSPVPLSAAELRSSFPGRRSDLGGAGPARSNQKRHPATAPLTVPEPGARPRSDVARKVDLSMNV